MCDQAHFSIRPISIHDRWITAGSLFLNNIKTIRYTLQLEVPGKIVLQLEFLTQNVRRTVIAFYNVSISRQILSSAHQM